MSTDFTDNMIRDKVMHSISLMRYSFMFHEDNCEKSPQDNYKPFREDILFRDEIIHELENILVLLRAREIYQEELARISDEGDNPYGGDRHG